MHALKTRPLHLTPVLTLTLPTFLAEFLSKILISLIVKPCQVADQSSPVMRLSSLRAESGRYFYQRWSIAESAAAIDSCGQSLIHLIQSPLDWDISQYR